MEALLEKEGDVESWNDERLDELSRRIDAGFAETATKVEVAAVDRKLEQSAELARREFGRLNDRLDKLFYGVGFVGLTIGLNILADKV
jgi:hypothetical protein